MKRPHEHEAEQIRKAIELFASKPDNLDNFESYLSMHLAEWLKKWASTPEGMAAEFKQFAEMEI